MVSDPVSVRKSSILSPTLPLNAAESVRGMSAEAHSTTMIASVIANESHARILLVWETRRSLGS